MPGTKGEVGQSLCASPVILPHTWRADLRVGRVARTEPGPPECAVIYDVVYSRPNHVQPAVPAGSAFEMTHLPERIRFAQTNPSGTKVERAGGIEHSVSWLETRRSDTELHPQKRSRRARRDPRSANHSAATTPRGSFNW